MLPNELGLQSYIIFFVYTLFDTLLLTYISRLVGTSLLELL